MKSIGDLLIEALVIFLVLGMIIAMASQCGGPSTGLPTSYPIPEGAWITYGPDSKSLDPAVVSATQTAAEILAAQPTETPFPTSTPEPPPTAVVVREPQTLAEDFELTPEMITRGIIALVVVVVLGVILVMAGAPLDWGCAIFVIVAAAAIGFTAFGPWGLLVGLLFLILVVAVAMHNQK